MTTTSNGESPDRLRLNGADLLSIRAVAETLRVHETRACRLVQEGDLTVVHKIGRQRYVRKRDVERYRRRRDRWLEMHGRMQTVSA